MSEIEALAQEILHYAVGQDAKQVLVEPQREYLRVRIRFGDDTAKEYVRLPKDQGVLLVTQFKKLAGLNTSLHKVIQRGWLAFSSSQTEYLLWITLLPTMPGEKIVVWFDSNEGLMPELRQPTCL